jgi:hypothetical protein
MRVRRSGRVKLRTPAAIPDEAVCSICGALLTAPEIAGQYRIAFPDGRLLCGYWCAECCDAHAYDEELLVSASAREL